VFYDKSNSKFVPPNGLSARALKASNNAAQAAQSAAQSATTAAQLAAQSAAEKAAEKAQVAAEKAQPAAQSAAENLGPAARTAAQEVSKSVRQGVQSARGWAAPRIETAADYWSDSAAPKVTDALRTTARQVKPQESTGRSVLKAILLSIAGLAGAGAIAILVQRQLGKSASRKEDGSDVMDAGDSGDPATAVPGQTASPAAQAGVPVNGQSSAW